MKEAWELFLHGGFVMWPLLVALIITVAIAIERIAYYRQLKREMFALNEMCIRDRILLNPDKQAPFERFFLLRSIPWLQKLNPLIDSVVGQELSRYSPDEITQIVRGKMYYDLQMVRINGSLIGAVLGGILYGLTIIVEGVLK